MVVPRARRTVWCTVWVAQMWTMARPGRDQGWDRLPIELVALATPRLKTSEGTGAPSAKLPDFSHHTADGLEGKRRPPCRALGEGLPRFHIHQARATRSWGGVFSRGSEGPPVVNVRVQAVFQDAVARRDLCAGGLDLAGQGVAMLALGTIFDARVAAKVVRPCRALLECALARAQPRGGGHVAGGVRVVGEEGAGRLGEVVGGARGRGGRSVHVGVQGGVGGAGPFEVVGAGHVELVVAEGHGERITVGGEVLSFVVFAGLLLVCPHKCDEQYEAQSSRTHATLCLAREPSVLHPSFVEQSEGQLVLCAWRSTQRSANRVGSITRFNKCPRVGTQYVQ